MEICILDLDKNVFGSRHIGEFNALFGDKMKINEQNIRLAWKKEIPMLPLLTNLMPPKMAERFRKLDNIIIQQGVEARRFIVLDRLTERTDEQRVSLGETCERINNQEYLTRLIFAVKFLELHEKFGIDVDEYVIMPSHLIMGKRLACQKQYLSFREIFPNGMILDEESIRYAMQAELSIDWYINHLVPQTVYDLHTNILGIAFDNFEEIKDGIRQEESRKLMQYSNLYSSKIIDIAEYSNVRDKTYEEYFNQQKKAHRSTALIIWLYTAELMHHYGDKS
jgi:hypothetical protein